MLTPTVFALIATLCYFYRWKSHSRPHLVENVAITQFSWILWTNNTDSLIDWFIIAAMLFLKVTFRYPFNHVFMHTLSFSPFLLEGFALFATAGKDAWFAPWVLVFARPEDGQTDVMTVGCTIHLRSGEVEMAVTVGTKESAGLVSISWKNPHHRDMQLKHQFSLSDEQWATLTFRYAEWYIQSFGGGMPKKRTKSILSTDPPKSCP